jgi:lipopolysaccharide heptosyltransferase II
MIDRNYKNILCIRADNMGDVLMSSPAIRALKDTFQCKITLLTSLMGGKISSFIPQIDEIIVADLPWIKTENAMSEKDLLHLVEKMRNYHFDAAVIFTVYSQNPLPAAMLAYMCGIPLRLAYCRENPYYLLTDWAFEKEPYDFIQHQVRRDLNLVKIIGAQTEHEKIEVKISSQSSSNALKILSDEGLNLNRDWIIFHPGVSEEKRKFPLENWIETGKLMIRELSCQIVITGSKEDESLCKKIQKGIGDDSISLAGLLSVEEFIAVIKQSPLLVSVNTGSVHIAAATQTPVVVLYALTNPQHTPWQVPCSVLYYSVQTEMQSKNEVIRFVNKKMMKQQTGIPSPEMILKSARNLLEQVSA